MVTLGSLQPGAIGIVAEIKAGDTAESMLVAERLREMGFGEGVDLEVRHDSPFGRDPMAVKVGGMLVAIRRKEAAHIIVSDNKDVVA